jgi:PAS domain S-box-containing protein
MELALGSSARKPRLSLDHRASHAYLHSLLEHNPIAVLVLDRAHRFQWCNPAFRQLFQYDPVELETWGIDSMISGPDFLQEATQITRRVLAGERVHILSKRRRKDGLMVDVEIHGVPLILDEEVVGVYGLYQDVTERMALSEAMQEMVTRLHSVREEERRRFARDLHDSLSQELALLNWNLNRLETLLLPQSDMALELLRETRELAELCGGHIRSASFLLHPPQLGEVDLTTAIGWLVEGFQKRSGIAVTVQLQSQKISVPMPLQAALYRVVQEGLANVLRHARDSSVQVKLFRKNTWLVVSVTNERIQPGHVTDVSSRGVGLDGMRERLEECGGYLQVDALPAGVHIVASVPIRGHVACAS